MTDGERQELRELAMALYDALEWLDNLEKSVRWSDFFDQMPNNANSRLAMRETLDKAKGQILGHDPRPKAGRQTCCKICHRCLRPLQVKLDGELWCPRCMVYR